MNSAWLLEVRFHDGRYHGKGDWPPAPARVFQALVAGAACGDELDPDDQAALEWLETLPAPTIAAPPAREGQALTLYVPNNDLDAEGGDPRRVEKIRAAMQLKPMLFDAATPLLYFWQADTQGSHSERLSRVADRLFQLGRGVDMAWAMGRWMTPDEAQAQLAMHPGAVLRPGRGSGVAVPVAGSLHSLRERHREFRHRFAFVAVNNTQRQVFSQPRKAVFGTTSYHGAHRRMVFEVQSSNKFHPLPLASVASTTAALVNAAAQRLATALPSQRQLVERCIVGRGATAADKATRLRLLPLPSIGHPDLIPAVRRFLADVPPDFPLPLEDLAWALDSLSPVDEATGETTTWRLVRGLDERMLQRYAKPATHWQTITAAALPRASRHRRSRKVASERLQEEQGALTCVRDALRHAGVLVPVAEIRVQREPLQPKGARAEAFAAQTRFSANAMWHVSVAFDEPVEGPLLMGDGRYLGLGLMEPVQHAVANGALAFALDELANVPAENVAVAFRNAMMARVGMGNGRDLAPYFTGHESSGAPLRRGHRAHVAICVDMEHARCLVVAPHLVDHRPASDDELAHWKALRTAMKGLRHLTLGPHRCTVTQTRLTQYDPFLHRSHHWEGVTSYQPTRHPNGKNLQDWIACDVARECRRRQLPNPSTVDITDIRTGKRGGLRCQIRLSFDRLVDGPVLLGAGAKRSHGLFRAIRRE